MTRKRFVKLCMAHGMSRNTAAEWALCVNAYGDYKTLYVVAVDPQMFLNAVPKLVKTIESWITQIWVALQAFVEAIGLEGDK